MAPSSYSPVPTFSVPRRYSISKVVIQVNLLLEGKCKLDHPAILGAFTVVTF